MRIVVLVGVGVFALAQLSYAAERGLDVRSTLPSLNRHLVDDTAPRLIVQRKHTSQGDYLKNLPASLQAAVTKRGYTANLDIVEFSAAVSRDDVNRALSSLNARDDIEYAVLDRRRRIHAAPSDSLYPTQWFLQDSQPAAIAANLAWDITTGGSGTVVAVLDTGVRFDHPDLQRATQAGKLLAGFDFVSGERNGTFLAANDGNGWDTDPSDPGDWIDSADRQQDLFSDCTIENSSWHGTRVAGLIGAASNNGIGIAGMSWGAYILPVRVLGKCGGYDSDILPAMRWAAGLHVSGVPDNPYPANIINLSFGSADPCNAAYQSVLQELAARGVTVIASAGNEGGPVGSPANCDNVIAVAGIRHAGTKVGYSNLGPEVDIAAPAGNCVNLTGACLFSLHTTYDIGRTTPSGFDYTDQFNINVGTSFSAPLAAGVAALMHSVNARLTSTHLRARLQASSTPFPRDPAAPDCRVPLSSNDLQLSECNCTSNTCGAGMLHAPGAVTAAQRPMAAIVAPTSFTSGSAVTLDANASAASCTRTIVSYRWEAIEATGTSLPTLAGIDQPQLQVNAPPSGSFTLRLTVTDSQGAEDSSEVVVASQSTSTSAIAPLLGNACPTSLDVTSQVTPTTAPPPVVQEQPRSGGGSMLAGWTFWCVVFLLGRRVRRLDLLSTFNA